MKFREVAEYFEQIEQESSRNKITKLLAELFKKSTSKEAEIIAYLSLGELYPTYKGIQFHLAEKSLIGVFSIFFDKTLETIKTWMKKLGDVGLVVTEHFEDKKLSKELTLLEVYKELEKIAAIFGTGSVEKKEKEILDLLKSLNAISAKYIVRIIAGKLRLGFSDMTLVDAFSWMEVGDKSLRVDLENAYNISADIGMIVRILKEDGIKAIKKMVIIPGIPIRPALAERLPNAKDIFKKLGQCVAQSKLDGFRLQVHVFKEDKKTKVKFYSRNLQDMSHMFPDLTKAADGLKVKTMVAEGEAIAYDQESDTFLPFQETVKRRRKHDIESVALDFPLKLYLFDLLYLNGKSMLDKPHKERRKVLSRVVKKESKDAKDVIFVVEERKIDSAQELEEDFNANISAGLEGIVVKREDAPYKPGKRNFNWIKLKREETGHLDDTIDCVVLGYYAGHGKRASFGIGACLVGVLNKEKEIFQTVAKIGTGFTDAGLKELKKRCDKAEVKIKPKNVECAKDLYPDVWCYPEIVFAVRADEITLSPVHTAGETSSHNGYALRFPRFMEYRDDKSAKDATTIKELDRLYEIQFEDKPKKRGQKKKRKSDKLGQKSLF